MNEKRVINYGFDIDWYSETWTPERFADVVKCVNDTFRDWHKVGVYTHVQQIDDEWIKIAFECGRGIKGWIFSHLFYATWRLSELANTIREYLQK